ncbi:hypothetical protein [Catenovulum maritimum]|uniref:Acetyltransferase n=1 Tax=Catenovulum maritimum TaxID=1513271 RepID=A0A0J8GRC0_9ALTE|nr:hypothetical protein [Catenovulum maritimum]KMT63794.1 acetyltransferase [Catenovulum maritimum]
MTQSHYDLFNGDADGICALLQLRLAEPKDSQLITGVKRDIKLLSKISVKAEDSITLLDVSMDKNKAALEQVLSIGAAVFYCDHHFAGEIPQAENLDSLIDTSANTCTSLLINQKLGGQFANWAITAAYGDNLFDSAEALADEVGLSQVAREQLKALGIAINYNGYGATEADLHFHPAELYKQLLEYPDPLVMAQENTALYQTLIANYQTDMGFANQAKLVHESNSGKAFVLPNEAWARRVSGVWGNDLANKSPALAHAVLTDLPDKSAYLVSVRAPKQRAAGADELCMKFETGGGRKAAAGINVLPESELQRFFAEFDQQFTV